MMGRKDFQPKLFYTFSLDDYVPQNHLLRIIDTYVDFEFVRKLVKPFYPDGGRPSTDPVVLFRMSLLGFLYGIVSERQLAEDVRLNLAYRWFLGYDMDETPPEHTALSKARARYGPGVFEQFFRRIVTQCQQAGLIQGEELYLDASLLPANASLDSLVSRPLFHQIPRTPGEHTSTLWEENENAPIDERPLNKRTSNERRVSRTDPDATIVVRKSDPRPYLAYKVHVAVDGDDHRIITAVSTTTGTSAESHELPVLMGKHRWTVRSKPKAVVADKGYGTAAVYQFLDEQRIDAIIPRRKPWSKVLKKRLEAGFRYDRQRDVYVCPKGKTMYRSPGSSPEQVRYRVHRLACNGCELQGVLCKSKRPSITRSKLSDLYEKVYSQIRSREGRRMLRKRGPWAETVFAEMKGPRGFATCRVRGLHNVHIYALLAAAAHNIRRFAKHMSSPTGTDGLQRARVPFAAASAPLLNLWFKFFTVDLRPVSLHLF